LHQEGQRESVAILVPPGSAIHSVTDLRGKRVGTDTGSVGHHLVLAALQHDGIPVTAVEIRYLLPADAKAALSAGEVDAWSTRDPYVATQSPQRGLAMSFAHDVWRPGYEQSAVTLRSGS